MIVCVLFNGTASVGILIDINFWDLSSDFTEIISERRDRIESCKTKQTTRES